MKHDMDDMMSDCWVGKDHKFDEDGDSEYCLHGCGKKQNVYYIEKLQSELAQLKADNEYLNRQLADERSGIQDRTLEKHLRWENEKLREKCAEYDRQLEIADDRIREMQNSKEITMKEMIIALKPIMWISVAMEKWKGKG